MYCYCNTNITKRHLQTNKCIPLISSDERNKLKLYLPYKYTIDVLKICEIENYTMPRGGKVTAQDIRNTLNGREHFLIEEAIFAVAEINKKKIEKLQAKRNKILNTKKIGDLKNIGYGNQKEKL